ncbi:MAG: helix-hairpin-helix domain-containing protein [Fibrobacteria bacterium]|nr:helix-hairpin-helix domain-containing protein [Fibrobacteria bacterium]
MAVFTKKEKSIIILIVIFMAVGFISRALSLRKTAFYPDSGNTPPVYEVNTESYALSDSSDSLKEAEEKTETDKKGEITKNANTSFPLDINKASIKEFQQLKGIGPKLAEKIIAYRNTSGNFQKPEDLIKVKGIGKKKLENLLPFICIKKDTLN